MSSLYWYSLLCSLKVCVWFISTLTDIKATIKLQEMDWFMKKYICNYLVIHSRSCRNVFWTEKKALLKTADCCKSSKLECNLSNLKSIPLLVTGKTACLHHFWQWEKLPLSPTLPSALKIQCDEFVGLSGVVVLCRCLWTEWGQQDLSFLCICVTKRTCWPSVAARLD